MKWFESKYFRYHNGIVGGYITVTHEGTCVFQSVHVRVSGCTVTFFYISELRNVFLIYTVFSMPWKCLAKTWLRVQRYAPGTVCCLFPCIVGYRSHQKHQAGVFLKFLVIRSLETCKVPSFLFNSEMTENVTREHQNNCNQGTEPTNLK